jgi:hypothetical protein
MSILLGEVPEGQEEEGGGRWRAVYDGMSATVQVDFPSRTPFEVSDK